MNPTARDPFESSSFRPPPAHLALQADPDELEFLREIKWEGRVQDAAEQTRRCGSLDALEAFYPEKLLAYLCAEIDSTVPSEHLTSPRAAASCLC